MSIAARLPSAGSRIESKVNFTASALNLVPSWKVTSSRSLSVSARPSGDSDQLVASPGNRSFFSSDPTSWSNTW